MRKTEMQTIFRHLNADLNNILICLKLKMVSLKLYEEGINSAFPVFDDNRDEVAMHVEITPDVTKAHREYMLAELRRSFINDLYLCISRYSIFIHRLLTLSNEEKISPDFSTGPNDTQPLNKLHPFLSTPDKEFLIFFHSIRNCIIHFDGHYNAKTQINYDLEGVQFVSEGNYGKNIPWGIKEMIQVYERIRKIYEFNAFQINPYFNSLMSRK